MTKEKGSNKIKTEAFLGIAFALLFFGVLFFCFYSAYAATITWDGSESTDWTNGDNWVGGAAPGSGDDVVIDGSYTNAPTLDISGGVTINSLSVGASNTSVLTLSNGDTTTGKLTVTNDVTVGGSGTITHTANTTAQTHILHIEAANINVQSGGAIDVDDKGYEESEGTEAGADGASAGGGGHGGDGGDGSAGAGGGTYGSIKQPETIGSGGGDYFGYYGGKGGGAIKLTVSGTLTATGDITANGQNSQGSYYGGGGSGGSIYITTGTLTGSSSITVNGGHSATTNSSGGGGGGGRIAVYYTTDSSSVTYEAIGGLNRGTLTDRMGGAGTIFTKAAAASNGDLLIDNDDQDNWDGLTGDWHIGKTPINETITFDTLTVQNYGFLNVGASANITYSSLDWSTEGMIEDNGGTFSLVSGGGSLTIPTTSRLLANTARTFTGLTANGTLTHASNLTTEDYKIVLTVNGNLDVGSSGSIDVSQRGYRYSEGPGAGTAGQDAGGGGFGGEGGDGSQGAGGSIYGSIKQPENIGSGGGNYSGYLGGSGGGAVKLTVSGTTTVTGSINANGQNSHSIYRAGGGSGGSVYITTGTLAGSGSITANGGHSATNSGYNGGGGGGGRIAIYYTTDSSSVTYDAKGGLMRGTLTTRMGGAGTIFTKADAASNGDLLIDNDDQDSWSDVRGDWHIGRTLINETVTFDAITLQNRGHIDIGSSANITYSSLDWSTEGMVTDSGGTFDLISGGGSLTIPATSRIYANTARTFTGLTINGTLTHTKNTTAETYKIVYTVNGNLDIGSSGAIDVNKRGYRYSEGTGAGTGGGNGGGGGYGGEGGDGSDGAGGSVYGSVKQPENIGSGGGNYSSYLGGNGGGAVKLTVSGTTTITGPISADGQNSIGDFWAGGGSGGSVYITTGTLAGAGSITANGGHSAASGSYYGGGGGGGRIAVYYTTDSSSVSYDAYGGLMRGTMTDRMGGAGTIFTKAAAASNGDLTIDNNDQDEWDDRDIGKTIIDETVTFDGLTIQNYGFLNLGTSANITYSSLDWSTEGIIGDNNPAGFALLSASTLTIPTTARLHANTTRIYTGLTINGTLTHSANYDAETNKIVYTVGGNVGIGSSGAINVSDKGYYSSYGTGAGSDGGGWGAGAGHGGDGGDSADGGSNQGLGYDTEAAPVYIGSGGGPDGSGAGSTGGGAVKIDATGYTINIDGDISADVTGTPGTDAGGGSGGSIYLICDTLTGSGTLSADGGDAQEANAGAGAGGRIALIFNTNSSSLSSFTVDAGSTGQTAEDGTIYPGLLPTISTEAASGVVHNAATGNGTISVIGLYGITQHGHLWSSSDTAPQFIDPIAQWKMNDDAANQVVDDTMGSYDGESQQNTEDITTTGKINGALSFNGSSDRITATGLNPPTGDFTYSFWVNLTTNNDEAFVGASNGSGNDNSFLLFSTGSGTPRVYINGNDQDFSSTIPTGGWAHLVFTRSGSSMKFYLNGTEDASTLTDGNTINTNASCPLFLGAEPDSGCTGTPGNWLAGSMDDVRVYDQALTQAQIDLLYNSGSGTEDSIIDGYTQEGSASSTGAFTSSITGLSTTTDYYYRSYATTSDGTTTYGDVENFTTLATPVMTYLEITGSGSQTAGNAQSVTITAKDQYGNTFTSYTGDKNITFSGASAAPDETNPIAEDKNLSDVEFGTATTLTFTSGTVTTDMTLYKSESAEIDITDGTYNSTGDAAYDLNVTVSPGSANAGECTFNASATAVDPSTAINFTITAYDSYENPLTSGSDTVVVTIAGVNASTPSVTDGGDGSYTISYTPTVSGSDQVTATINTNDITQDNEGASDGIINITVNTVATEETEEDDDDDDDDEDLENLEVSKVRFQTRTDRIIVRWKTNRYTNGTVRYGLNKNLVLKRKHKRDRKRHKIVLKRLAPGTTYYIRVKSKTDDGVIDRSKIYEVTTEYTSNPIVSEPLEETDQEEPQDPNLYEEIVTDIEEGIEEIVEDIIDGTFVTEVYEKGKDVYLSSVEVLVVDQHDNPAPNVTLSLNSGESEATTDDRGYATLKNVPSGTNILGFNFDKKKYQRSFWVKEPITKTGTVKGEVVVIRVDGGWKGFVARNYQPMKTFAIGTLLVTLVQFLIELGSARSFTLLFKNSIFRLFAIIGRRKKKEIDWGVVYDVTTGAPLPLAIVSLFDKDSGKIRESKITDKYGVYYFLVAPGKYSLDIKKKGYVLHDLKDADSLRTFYSGSYNAETLKFKEHSKIDKDIAMKAVVASVWIKIIKRSLVKYSLALIFWLGMLCNIAILILVPTPFNFILIAIYLYFAYLRNISLGQARWGTVINQQGENLAFSLIKLNNTDTNELTARTIADEKGRYFFVANPGNYNLEAYPTGETNPAVTKKISLEKRESIKEKLVAE